MGKLKSVLIGAAALCCPFLAGTSSAAGDLVRSAAYYSTGAFALPDIEIIPDSVNKADTSDSSSSTVPEPANSGYTSTSSSSETSNPRTTVTGNAENSHPDTSEPVIDEPPQKLGKVITLNRPESTDDTDYSEFTSNDGEIYRYNFGKSKSTEYITLGSGAQVRNCTDMTNAELAEAAKITPSFGELDSEQPSVLIYHTHTSESFLPFGDSFDADYPLRSGDPSRNMTAVGDAICDSLSKRGIGVVHDCTVYDSPMFTGAYYRSADGMLEILEKYPSIKIVLDIHRDGIINADGSLDAPIAEIDGKNAAQFMIITGCDDGEMDMPDYMENFKLACLLQNCAEEAYPDLARAVLFDYRNYNQSLSTGALLIEVGSHGNSLDEALYTGELLGNIIADALERGE
ncbi:MAG: stage II sporulation protein P [Ruminococcaceae bacterium]|nr:stage II sporulation protein P [Oscillospiraceae bacterium]